MSLPKGHQACSVCLVFFAGAVIALGIFGATVLQSLLETSGVTSALAEFQGTSRTISSRLQQSLTDASAGFNGMHAVLQAVPTPMLSFPQFTAISAAFNLTVRHQSLSFCPFIRNGDDRAAWESRVSLALNRSITIGEVSLCESFALP